MSPARLRAVRQLAASYLVLNALVYVLSRAVAMRYGLHELIGALFLLGALLSIRADDDDTDRYGVRLAGIFPGAAGDDRSLVRTLWEAAPVAAREFGVALAVAAVVLPVYAACWPYFNRMPASRQLFTPDRARDVLTNLLATALTEEMYFRGYVQTRLADVFARPPGDGAATEPRADAGGTPARSAGGHARVAVARVRAAAGPIVLGSALFAATHVIVEVTPARAAVFFPSLLFGALRAWRGGIGAAVFLHAAANLFELYLEGR